MGRAPLGIALSLEKDLTGQRLDNGEPPQSLLFSHPQYAIPSILPRGDGMIWRDGGLPRRVYNMLLQLGSDPVCAQESIQRWNDDSVACGRLVA